MSIGYPKSWVVAPRTTLDESPSMSKNVRRYGKDGSKGDFPHGSTGQSHIEEIDRNPNDNAPSVPARHVGRIGEMRREVVGHAPDGSGKWLKPTHDPELIGNAIATHPSLEPQGLAHSASGGKHGKPSKVPTEKFDGYRTVGGKKDYRQVARPAVLNGDSDPNPGYTGGRGPIKP